MFALRKTAFFDVIKSTCIRKSFCNLSREVNTSIKLKINLNFNLCQTNLHSNANNQNLKLFYSFYRKSCVVNKKEGNLENFPPDKNNFDKALFLNLIWGWSRKYFSYAIYHRRQEDFHLLKILWFQKSADLSLKNQLVSVSHNRGAVRNSLNV